MDAKGGMKVSLPATDGVPLVDVSFPVRGSRLRADHGFALYSAIARAVPALHGDEALAILPIAGLPGPDRTLTLRTDAQLRLRVPGDRVGSLLPLAGKSLLVDGDQLALGIPTVRLVTASPSLQSRLVVISPYTEPESFLGAVERQLAAMDVSGKASLGLTRASSAFERRSSRPVGAPIRRTLNIHGRAIVGFAVRVDQLSAAESLTLQARGLGGRRHFGCGVFVPVTPRT